MMDWESHLAEFLAALPANFGGEIAGVLACGSYITGNPSSHSDLDVHLILREGVTWRERGNRIVGGLLIEYFATPPAQIRRTFAEDISDGSLMCQVMFATGKILRDDQGTAAALKAEALSAIQAYYERPIGGEMPLAERYYLWDMLDDLQDAYDNSRLDFDFLYHNILDRTIQTYIRRIGRPYSFKAVLMNTADLPTAQRKYLLRELPHPDIAGLIAQCITAGDRAAKMALFRRLHEAIIALFGGFDIATFTLRSPTESP